MSSEDARAELAKGAIQLVDRSYDDLLSGSFREAGRALTLAGRALNVALSPLRGAIWSAEQIEAWIEDEVGSRLEGRRASALVSPPLALTIEVLEHVRLLEEGSTIRAAFASLLATAIDARSAPSVHPAFPSILGQLTPDEAKLLTILWKRSSIRAVVVERRTGSVMGGMSGGHEPKTFVDPVAGRALSQPELAGLYMDNLHRLRLANIDRAKRYSAEEDAYFDMLEVGDALAARYRSELDLRLDQAMETSTTHEGTCDLTELGRSFCLACFADAPASDAFIRP